MSQCLKCLNSYRAKVPKMSKFIPCQSSQQVFFILNSFTFPSGEESMVVEVELPPAVASAPEEPEPEDEDKPEEDEEEGDEETKSR